MALVALLLDFVGELMLFPLVLLITLVYILVKIVTIIYKLLVLVGHTAGCLFHFIRTEGPYLWTCLLYIVDIVCRTYYYTGEYLTKIDQLVKDIIRSLFDNVYFIATKYLLNMSTEVCLGIVVAILCVFLCKRIHLF